jgi:uncharacterized membrane protein YoaK (UPF0700 family)
MNDFLAGVCATTFAAAAVFFLRFYRQTSDRFFAIFAVAFATFAVNYLGLGFFHPGTENRQIYFTLRLIAFLFIIAGIIDKNRRS